MSAREFGMPDDPAELAQEGVKPYLRLSLAERYLLEFPL